MAAVRTSVLLLLVAAGCHRGAAAPDQGRAPALGCGDMQGCTERCAAADDACVKACVARLTVAARPVYDALAACVAPACATPGDGGGVAPCRVPGSFACKMCVLARCTAAASACMAH